MSGEEIKSIIRQTRLHQWEVARILSVNETTLSKWLRADPVPEARAKGIMEAVEKLKEKM